MSLLMSSIFHLMRVSYTIFNVLPYCPLHTIQRVDRFGVPFTKRVLHRLRRRCCNALDLYCSKSLFIMRSLRLMMYSSLLLKLERTSKQIRKTSIRHKARVKNLSISCLSSHKYFKVINDFSQYFFIP